MKKVLRATCPGACALAAGSQPAALQGSTLTRDPEHCLSQQDLAMYCTSCMVERILCTVHSRYHGAAEARRDLWGLSGAPGAVSAAASLCCCRGWPAAAALLCYGHTRVSVTRPWAGTVLTCGTCTHPPAHRQPAPRGACRGQRLDQLQPWEGAVGVCAQQHLSS